jgi:hypothetical protein
MNIDKPNNKSGKKQNPDYPIFTNQDFSYVYYDKKEIVDSAYLRDKFFFELEPFTLDSLNTFDPYLSDLDGKLVSAGIFPDFKEKLRIQEDLSLGFRRITPEKGFNIYGDKGTYRDSVFLSNNGLRGQGRVNYLFTYFESDSILFCPDSLNALADTFFMKKTEYLGLTYPEVIGENNFIHWRVYQDSMLISSISTPFIMYQDSSTMSGDLILTAQGLKGSGDFEFKEASLSSNQFNFMSESLSADTMAMKIKSLDQDKVTFNTPNVKGTVNFADRIGEFKSNETDIPTQFDNNAYKTNINSFANDESSLFKPCKCCKAFKLQIKHSI